MAVHDRTPVSYTHLDVYKRQEYNLPEKVEAPIKKGDVIGTATYTYANQELTTVNLVASESVERSELLLLSP